MEVIYGLIPGMILMGLVAVGVFFWAARSGQFDDLQGEAHRILMDEDLDEAIEEKADAVEPGDSAQPVSSESSESQLDKPQ